MLDKSLPYYHILMRRPAGTPVPEFSKPANFSIVNFTLEDELAWAEIVSSVGEFDFNTEQALLKFKEKYLPSLKELERRLIFIQTKDGENVATYTNWWTYSGELRIPKVDYVAVKPKYQGLGLGKAIVFAGLQKFLELEGDKDLFLHTQTWSYKAIGIYLQAGFNFVEDNFPFGRYTNGFNTQEKALAIIKDKIRYPKNLILE
ncbi:TPA: GNAT family N-acetyltransferase [Candidatus Dependentiae bacterium]|nr:MAG: Acetyltransferase, GNAT family [candidate division TM6 bacterium GW2011_GWE2_31_21]KKP54038.1 MAG: Acetyltransferase, GNAT family [candidate division TM6 bacterium GW2011_GWF2_33_332]HBS48380.1 GNAT family N-acetyltransferase [Candidatus Dependentiae bacterium]HBZ72946.1 GNAT family N-acetyltransferase [Candidatus Dependentiae bacterium]